MKYLGTMIVIAGLSLAPPAACAQDLITGGGAALSSTNEGSVTLDSNFEQGAKIRSGTKNSLSASAVGGEISVSISRIGDSSGSQVEVSNTIQVGSATARNSGVVTANSTFSGAVIKGGSDNTIGARASGASITLSISDN